jgi:hypothetical protein
MGRQVNPVGHGLEQHGKLLKKGSPQFLPAMKRIPGHLELFEQPHPGDLALGGLDQEAKLGLHPTEKMGGKQRIGLLTSKTEQALNPDDPADTVLQEYASRIGPVAMNSIPVATRAAPLAGDRRKREVGKFEDTR